MLYVHAPDEKNKLGAIQLKCDANASFKMWFFSFSGKSSLTLSE
jgi:hypothetical protein